MHPLIEAFAAHATRAPEREALSDEAGRRWTYGRLQSRVSAVARELVRNGVSPGGRVAVIGGRTADTVTALLGVLYAGAAYCVLDPELPKARQDVVLADLAPDAVLVADGDWGGESTAPFVGGLGDLAYVMYTSGSTGKPKGVLVEHGSVLNMLCSYDELAPPGDELVGSLVAPCGFDVSVWEIFSVLTRGGTLRGPSSTALRGGAALWRFLVDSGVTSAYVPPGLLASLVDAAERDTTGRAVLDRVLVGVEPIPQCLLDRFRAAVPGLRVVNGYGPTETTITATLYLLGEVDDPARRTPIGRPVLGSTIELVDDWLEPVPDGEPGEIVVFGDCLARGYHGVDGGGFLTLRGRRAYRTGDYARLLPDGSLEFVGRQDGQVKINGFRVETGEVESVLVGAPGVRRGLVLVTGDPGALRMVAAVEADVPSAAVVEHLAARLPAYMVPSRVVVVPSFPLTANGKVDTAALLVVDRQRPADAPLLAPPETEDQLLVAGVWAEVLGVADVGLDDDFHWLGGTSLDAVRIATRLTDEGRPLSAAAVLSARTVRVLCALDPMSVSVSTPAAPGTYPASRAHEGLWVWRQLAPDDTSSTVVHAIRLGNVDPERVRRAMIAVVARHEALRTTFHEAGTRVEQRVAASGPIDVPVVNATDESEVDKRLHGLLAHRFDVTVRSWAAELLLGNDFAALVFAADHLVFDGESAVILERDLMRAFEDGAGPAVPGPASAGALATPSPERMTVLRDYWGRALGGLADMPALPEPLERTAAAGRRRLERDLPESTWTSLVALARRERTTPFVVVLAALKAFLWRRSAVADNVVSIAVSRRHAVGCPHAIGHFVNLVPVRDVVSGVDQSFRQYLAVVVDKTRESLAYSDLPFEDIIAAMPRPSGATVISPARIVLAQQAEGAQRAWPHIPLNALYDLTVFLTEGGRLDWVWDTAKVLPGAAEWAAEAFDAFLAAVVEHPDRDVADAPMFAAGEAELIRANTGEELEYPSIVELVSHQVRTRPDAIAVQDDERLVTYAELDRRAEEIQSRLPAGPGRVVAVVLEKSVDLLAALLAVLRAGAAYLPVAPEHAGTRLADLVRRADATACVTRSGLVDGPDGTPVVLVDGSGGMALPVAVTGEDLAYVMPTSGTTGEPKLVGVPHRAVSRLVSGSRTLPLDHDDRTLLVSNPSFDAATFEIWGALANGGCVVVPAAEELREPALLCWAVERYGITAGFFTVTLFERLVEAEPARLAGMKHILVGGEAVPPRLFAEAAQHVPPTALMNGYGPTENTTFSCCYRLDRDPAALRSVPIGPPITGSGAVVVDESLWPVPVGVAGEILVCGAGLALGYLNDPELTRKRFVRFGDRLAYRTGDLGRLLPDGALEYLGRLDRQLKIRGFRVEPGEVEVALEQHPAVRRAAAYAERVAGTLTLRAAVEANGVDGLALRSWLAARLPEYLVPERVTVVDEFPMTANGKLDQAVLRPDPVPTRPAEPSTAAERELNRIWSELLDVPRIGLDDDVFSLGANSMTVLAVAGRVKRELGWILPTHLVYSVRTVRGLAAHVQGSVATDDPELRLNLERRAALRRKARSRRHEATE